MMTIQITGLEDLAKKLSPERMTQVLSRAVDRASQILRDDTKRMPPVSARTTGYGAIGIPVDTGLMRQQIQARKLQLLAADVIANTNYSRFVQDGTAKMPPRPFFQYALETGSTERIL